MKESKPSGIKITKPLILSLVLHGALLTALLLGSQVSLFKPEPQGNLIQAVVVDPQAVAQQAQKIRQQREAAAKQEQQRLDKLRRESEQLEKNRKAEEERIRRLKEQQAKEEKATREAEQQRKQKEQEQKLAQEKAQQEQEKAKQAEAERKLKEAAAKKAEAERVAKEKAAQQAEQQRQAAEKERLAQEQAAKAAQEKAKREQEAAAKAEQLRIEKEQAAKAAQEKAKREKERLEQLERERKEQEAALNDIFAGLATEAQSNVAAREQYVTSEIERLGAIYKQLIQKNLLVEDSFRGKECRVNLRLLPTGAGALVGELSILSGDNRLCAATRRAVAQVGSFPLPKQDESDIIAKLRNINLTVVPE